MRLFIDTWGWITLSNRQEPRHTETRRFYVSFQERRGRIYTTDYVLDETITLLFRRLPFQQARVAVESIDNAIGYGSLRLEWIGPDRCDRAKELRRRFQDKPLISFTDLTSIVVMEELEIQRILTEDEHFTHVGMGFERVP